MHKIIVTEANKHIIMVSLQIEVEKRIFLFDSMEICNQNVWKK